VRHHIEVREEGAQRGVAIATMRTDGPHDYKAYLTALAEALEAAAANVRRSLGQGTPGAAPDRITQA
jgi:hypothetical protein